MRLPLRRTTARTDPIPGDDRLLNIAHRGASGEAPENTLAAVRRAIAHDADMVEVDVQRTRDGALVLLHDTTLERTTDVAKVFPRRAPWRVADFSYDELVRLDAGCWKSQVFEGERIPLLDDLLALVRGTSTGLLLEVKAPSLYPGIVDDVVGCLHRHGTMSDAGSGRLLVESFSFAAMKDMKVRAPQVPVGLLGAPAVANLPVLATWADMINPHHRMVDEAYVDLVHRLGMQCLLWTVNRPQAMRRALRMGADGIITNHPAVLGRVSAERLTRPRPAFASAGRASRGAPASPRTW